MATTKVQAKEAVMEEPVKEQVQAPVVESIYTADQLAANHKVFKAPREIVVVALRLAGKKEATFTEAQSIIESFKNKEVK